ncbi:hypothetical protein P3T37_003229 [Kitasatospora sp. MAA4]|uniref:RICIN domain-containing protein n=1 Tax=Kitasatospora sp. MAA4 TaxID=3035093 RepID=UPI00247644CF|nr:RICIN domain-containing protein [Kitasatospora sp. MAA4]MDH6133831.1 hypothetical protein [Kitasatospora sp. MAA4]
MRTRKSSALLAVAVTVGMAALGLAQTANAATAGAPKVIDVTSVAQIPTVHSHLKGQVTPNVVYRLTMTNNHGGKCLDGDLNTIGNNGGVVQLWDCNGWNNQVWDWVPSTVNGAGWYTIQNDHGGQCLDGDLNGIPNNGAKVQLWGCNGWNNQQWAWGGATLVNGTGGQCLDGDLNTIGNNGGVVQLWACNGWDNQAWTTH